MNEAAKELLDKLNAVAEGLGEGMEAQDDLIEALAETKKSVDALAKEMRMFNEIMMGRVRKPGAAPETAGGLLREILIAAANRVK